MYVKRKKILKKGPCDKIQGKPGDNWSNDKGELQRSKQQTQHAKGLHEPDKQASTENEGDGNWSSIKNTCMQSEKNPLTLRQMENQYLLRLTGMLLFPLSSHWVKLLQIWVEPSSKQLNAYDNSAIQVKDKTFVCYL